MDTEEQAVNTREDKCTNFSKNGGGANAETDSQVYSLPCLLSKPVLFPPDKTEEHANLFIMVFG
jgi:hypothetical protein